MKKGKKNRENKARRQRDDKVSLKHTSTHKEHKNPYWNFCLCIQMLNHRSNCQHTASWKPQPSSQPGQRELSFSPRQEGREAWSKETRLYWGQYRNHTRFSESTGVPAHWFSTRSFHGYCLLPDHFPILCFWAIENHYLLSHTTRDRS